MTYLRLFVFAAIRKPNNSYYGKICVTAPDGTVMQRFTARGMHFAKNHPPDHAVLIPDTALRPPETFIG